ncbi:restriction endonuclease subunit S [Vibrio splendidus]|uniref:restriction endonuclease subunit S n=1 Tax=Vibrio splendidus TaxID=29497 RepID=UPI0020A49153|nr:restriction endonuclease subunit S [Vibrio splendidus]
MTSLPNNWKEVKWNDITGIDGFRRGPFGGNLKKSCFVDEGFAVYEQYAPINNDCSSFRYFITADKFEELSGFQVQGGDFLISCSGTMGKITCVPQQAPKGVINQALLRIRLQDKFIDSDYFLRLFKSPQVQSLVLNKSVGGAIQNLAAVKELKEIPLPIAPLAEQKRIVEKLDEVLAQVATIKARLDGIPALLKRFRQSVLASAVSGKLTEEWRGSNFDGESAQCLKANLSVSRFDFWKQEQLEKFKSKGKLPKSDKWKEKYKPVIFVKSPELGTIPESWEWSSLEELSIVISDGDHNPPKKTSEGVRHLTVKNVNNGEISFEGCAYVSESGYAQTKLRYEAKTNDILLTCIGTVGRVAIVGEDTNFSTDRNLAYIRLCDALDVKYMKFLLMSPMMQRFMSGGKVGNAQSALYLKVIRALPTPLAPLEEQKEIVRLVDQYFAFADTIETQVKKAQARVDNLTQSILAKAFRGELVPQDPNDEPAEKLLERIAEARKEAEALAKAAKKAETARKKAAKAK